MPLYEYRCENGHVHEVLQRSSEANPDACPECGAAVERLFPAPTKPKVRGGRQRKDVKFRRKGESINLQRDSGES